MKVLFAVNNDKISENVIKRYPKEYKELLSYKNVYYFNAILKEIQNDKSYDRIVISEDLEPFVNTNHDSIDNFLFNNLDKISDEAQGNDGKEISIILICSERRNFGSNILNKLFSIGIYNALIGNDRSMDNLCKLINRPRTKKEAKIYYRIDQATYESAVETGGVSEPEIQSILNHFKKLGKSTDRYTDSFNNIAAQYTDDQLKLIINVLPIKVKAVLEAECPKYQNLMGTSGAERTKTAPVESGIRVNTIGSGRETNMNGPIVIPSGIKRWTSSSKNQSNVVASKVNDNLDKGRTNQTNIVRNQAQQVAPKVQQQVKQNPVQPQTQRPVQQQAQIQQVRKEPQGVQGGPVIPKNMSQRVNPVVETPIVKNEVPQVANKNVVQENKIEEQIINNSHDDTKRYTGTIAQVKRTLIARRKVIQNNTQVQENLKTIVPEVEQEQKNDFVEEQRRGRGRPKKIVTEQEVKPKGKRGRPRKNPIEEDNNLDDLLNGLGNNIDNDEVIMPGLEDEMVLPGLDNSLENSEVQNEAEIDSNENEVDVLPGLDDSEGEEVDVNSLLAGLDDNSDVLPGLAEEIEGINNDNDDDEILPGLDETTSEDVVIPGLDDEDDGMLPGLDETTSEDVIIPGLDDEDDGILPGLDETTSEDVVIPGLDEEENDNNVNISGLEDDEETILPGMGFESEEENNSSDSNSIESIKPQIDYSMSNLNSLLSKDKKIVAFLGATKNGTSFLINNLALMFSMMGIDTAILDMTQNKNSYYLFTDSREELRKIAYTSLSKLENGYAEGIKFNKNLTVYTGLPSDGAVFENAEPILSTLIQNHSLVLIDTDFTTPPAYFASSQEIYLVQSMDILTIQPLTAFLRDLKFKGAWEPEKARVVINKEVPIRILSNKTIIGGMSRYNGPDMSVMTDLFNKDMVKACSIPFDEKVYSKYLETLATCKLSISSLPKQFLTKLQILGEMVYPRLNSKTSYNPSNYGGKSYKNNENAFSNDTNKILNKMKKKF